MTPKKWKTADGKTTCEEAGGSDKWTIGPQTFYLDELASFTLREQLGPSLSEVVTDPDVELAERMISDDGDFHSGAISYGLRNVIDKTWVKTARSILAGTLRHVRQQERERCAALAYATKDRLVSDADYHGASAARDIHQAILGIEPEGASK